MSRRLAFATLHRLGMPLPVRLAFRGVPARGARRHLRMVRDEILTHAVAECLEEAAQALEAGSIDKTRDRLDEAESLRALLSRAGRRRLREFDR